jgi:hypothetical protein
LNTDGFIGDKNSFDGTKILAFRSQGLDPRLLERAILCLEYVSQLRARGLEFVFKGGTACQLLLPEPIRRLSIDVDISIDFDKKVLEGSMDRIKDGFKGNGFDWRPVEMKKGLPEDLALYNISAPSLIDPGGEMVTIKLDAILYRPRYKTQRVALRTAYYNSETVVEVPVLEAMLGDKLTTLGPKTVGRPLDIPADYAKQVYDIGRMLASAKKIEDIASAYSDCFEYTKTYRGLDITILDALKDLDDVCRIITTMPFPPKWLSKEQMDSRDKLLRGFEGFSGYITKRNRFTKKEARETASRIVFLGKLLERYLRREMNAELCDRVLNEHRTELERIATNRKRFEDALIRIQSLPEEERWHVYLGELRNSPMAAVYWYGYWFMDDLWH